MNITRSVIYKSNKWENYIITPKLDGTRALLIFYNNSIYLLFETKLELIAENVITKTIVVEAEIFENGIYMYDLHYIDRTIVNITFI